MKIETAHIILIVTAIAFFLAYAGFELLRWSGGTDATASLRAGASVLAAGIFALYLRSFVKALKRG